MMKVCDNETLSNKLRGVRALVYIMAGSSECVNDYEWALAIIEEALEDCIEFVEQKEAFIE